MSKDYFGELEPEAPFVKPVHTRMINFEGQRFGKWLVLKRIKKGKYICQCDCGFIGSRVITMLVNIQTTQCSSCYKKSKEFYFFKKARL